MHREHLSPPLRPLQPRRCPRLPAGALPPRLGEAVPGAGPSWAAPGEPPAAAGPGWAPRYRQRHRPRSRGLRRPRPGERGAAAAPRAGPGAPEPRSGAASGELAEGGMDGSALGIGGNGTLLLQVTLCCRRNGWKWALRGVTPGLGAIVCKCFCVQPRSLSVALNQKEIQSRRHRPIFC